MQEYIICVYFQVNAMDKKVWTVRDVLNWTCDYLESKGLPEPRLDVEYLLAYILKVNRLNLYMQMDRPMTKKELNLFKSLIKRRLSREPIQYIIGRAYIWKYEFFVQKGVFIPRRETETLIETAVNELKKKSDAFVLDVGCGCGCIILSLARDLASVKGVGVDVDLLAIKVSVKNREFLNVQDKIFFVLGDLFSPFKKRELFNAIVSNPPYVRSDEVEVLADEIKRYEPRIALDGGRDGLDFIRKLVKESPAYLKSGGFVALEVGVNQASSVKFLMERSGFVKVRTEKDLSGVERVVIGWKP